MDLPPVLDGADVVGVERLADHVEDVAEGGVADGHGQAPAEVAHRRAPVQAVGRLQADAADPALADLLGDLGGDGDLGALELEVHLDGHVDLGQACGGNSTSTTGPAMATTRPSGRSARCRWWSVR